MKKMILKRFMAFLCAIILVITLCGIDAGKTSSASSVSTVLFTSDIHSKTTNCATWLKYIKKAKLKNVSYLCYNGDYADSFDSDVLTKLTSIGKKYFPKAKSIYTMGNHEWKKSGTQEAFKNITGYNSNGLCAKTSLFEIYTFGAMSTEQTFTDEQIEKLSTFLASASTKTPIFIVSHYPLHTYTSESSSSKESSLYTSPGSHSASGSSVSSSGSSSKTRTTNNAQKVIELLNQYPNTIFIWGHSHTVKDSAYGTVKKKGDSIEYTSGSTETINFTYASSGCMKDGASHGIYGLAATVKKSSGSWKVTFQYWGKKAKKNTSIKLKSSEITE